MVSLKIAPSEVRGFNYHPSYSTGTLEDWLLFDESVWEKEIRRGKQYFPNFNTLRIWLSWNAYCRLEGELIRRVRHIVELCRSLDIYVIPVLFNRWHDPMIDCDGVYIDHFLPNSSWLHKFGNLFEDYIDDLCKEFKDEEQILVWDVCNEPLAYNPNFPWKEDVQKHEIAWLRRMADRMRANGVCQPLGVGSTGGQPMAEFEGIFDVYLTHLYMYSLEEEAEFEQTVARFAEEARRDGKPLITSECCWGSLDDAYRAELIKKSLAIFKKYGVGYVVHALQYSVFPDLHDPEDGRVTPGIGNLCFVGKDGKIRPHHEIFNEF